MWKDGQPGSWLTAVGLCRLRLSHTLAVLTVSKFCWGWLKWEKSFCRPHAGVPGTIRKQLCPQEGACPLSQWICWRGSQPHGETLARTLQQYCWDLNLGSSYVLSHLTSHLHSWGRWEHGKTQSSEAGERRMPREKGLRCPAHSMDRMTTIVRLLNGSFGILPSAASEFNTHFWVSNRKWGKNMRLEVERRQTTAPAQGSTKFSSIFKLQYLKQNQQNN